jgi:hypothetical protein
MSNHFHVVAVPAHEEATAKALGRLEADYARFSTYAGGLPGIFGRPVTIPSPWSRRTVGGRWPTLNATRRVQG